MAEKMIKKILKKSYLLIGLIVFILIIKDVNFEHLKNRVSEINFFWFGLAALVLIFDHIIRAIRWKIIVASQTIYHSLKDSLFMYGASSLLGAITPGKLGDFSRIVYLKKEGHSLGKSFTGNFLEKIFDLFFGVPFVLIGAAVLPFVPHLSNNYVPAFKWGSLIVLISVFLVIFVYKKTDKGRKFLLDILKELKKIGPKELFLVSSITIFEWLLYFLTIYFISISIGLTNQVNFFYIAFSGTFVLFASFLPISILNIGTRETTLLFLLAPFAVAKETIILFSLLIMLNSLIVMPLFLFCWIKKPLI